MNVQPITKNSFGANVTSLPIQKRTYMQRAKHSVTQLEKDYFKSLHKEAMARKSYLDYRKVSGELSEYEESVDSLKDAWAVIKIFARLANKKLNSIIYSNEAYKAFPNRFVEPDNKYVYPHRYYQLKSYSSKELPLQIKKC